MYEIENEPSKLSTAETIRLALTFCLLWFMANYTTNASLAYTSVTSSTILSSMSGRIKGEKRRGEGQINTSFCRLVYTGHRSISRSRAVQFDQDACCLHKVRKRIYIVYVANLHSSLTYIALLASSLLHTQISQDQRILQRLQVHI